MTRYDAIVVGAGHNGLVCAAYLGAAGLRVGVLERRDVIGGCSTTETLLPDHPEFRFNRGAIDLAHFQGTSIIDDLELDRHGLELIYHDPLWYFPFPDGTAISFHRDVERTCASIATISPRDADAYREFIALWDSAIDLLHPIDQGPPPPMARLGALASLAGRRGEEVLHLLLSSPKDLALNWFESTHMRGVMGWMGVQAGTPPDQPAASLALTQLALSHRNGVARARGGMGGLCEALLAAVRANGGTLHLDSRVDEVLLDGARRRVTGVRVGSDRIEAPIVVCTVDARRVFADLIDGSVLPLRLDRRVRRAHTRYPSLFKVDVALRGRPTMPHPGSADGVTASVNLAPSLEAVERAWNAYEEGRLDDDPPLMCALPSILDSTLAPAGQHTLWLSQFNPGPLWETSSDAAREACADTMIEAFARYAPDVRDLIIDRAITTPYDRERETGNRHGNPFHLDMTVDQSLGFRPVVGLADYRTPVEGLYLSGSGTHPGGGVTGVPGLNAARVILRHVGNGSRPRLRGRVRDRAREGAGVLRAWRAIGGRL